MAPVICTVLLLFCLFLFDDDGGGGGDGDGDGGFIRFFLSSKYLLLTACT